MAETNQDNTITLVDNEGNQKDFQIMMVIHGEEQFGKNYLIVAPMDVPEGEEIELLTFSFEPDANDESKGTLSPIESPEEWAMVNDIFGDFVNENDGKAFEEGIVNVTITAEEPAEDENK